MAGGQATAWLVWGLLSLAAVAVLGWLMIFDSPMQKVFLLGATSGGHHQIELACQQCHRQPFGGIEALQAACVDCHGGELEAAKDSHPKSKFTDPRNADRLAKLDVRYCVICHREHRPAITRAMGVTQPEDYCYHCHGDIGEERRSHAGLAFNTCADSGCHNFHDNRALYEDFLASHQNEPALRQSARLLVRDADQAAALAERPSLGITDADAPPPEAANREVIGEWAASRHAAAGINCTDCHAADGPWQARPAWRICQGCHQRQAEGFLAGKHGMRLAAGLTAMRPALARLPMRHDAHERELTCESCHGAHDYDIRRASVDACLGCHDDRHSRAYPGSVHHRIWQKELAGAVPPGSGVSCASCHLPRQAFPDRGGRIWVVSQHNQNDNLRPNEKMIRSVCLTCHGLGFSLDALADPALIADNFSSPPVSNVQSLDWVARRIGAKSGGFAGPPDSPPAER